MEMNRWLIVFSLLCGWGLSPILRAAEGEEAEPVLTADWREWTDEEGRVVVARFRAANEGAGLMEMRFGEVYLVDLGVLSAADRKYLRRLVTEGMVPRLRSDDEIIGEIAEALSQPYNYSLPRSINQYVRDLPEVVEAQRRADLAPKEKYFDERDRLRRTIIAAEDEYDRFFRVFLEPVGSFIGINNTYGPTRVELPYLHGLEFLGRFDDPANRRRCLRFLKQQPGYLGEVKAAVAVAVEQSAHMVDRAEINAFRTRLARAMASLDSVFSDETGLSHDELRDVAWLLEEVRGWLRRQEEAQG